MIISTYDFDRYETPQSCTIASSSVQLVTLAEVKDHLNITSEQRDDDDYLNRLLKVVTKALESAVNHSVRKRSATFRFIGSTGKFKITEQAIINFKSVVVENTSGGDLINDYSDRFGPKQHGIPCEWYPVRQR